MNRPASRGWEGTHAKGSCEPGRAGRCSHKQRTLVQWISLSQQLAAGAFFEESAPCDQPGACTLSGAACLIAAGRLLLTFMAKRKASSAASESTPAPADG